MLIDTLVQSSTRRIADPNHSPSRKILRILIVGTHRVGERARQASERTPKKFRDSQIVDVDV